MSHEAATTVQGCYRNFDTGGGVVMMEFYAGDAATLQNRDGMMFQS